MTDTVIEIWHIEPTELTDGSKVYDLIGASDEARVVFNCVDERAALVLQAMLMSNDHISGCSAESS